MVYVSLRLTDHKVLWVSKVSPARRLMQNAIKWTCCAGISGRWGPTPGGRHKGLCSCGLLVSW